MKIAGYSKGLFIAPARGLLKTTSVQNKDISPRVFQDPLPSQIASDHCHCSASRPYHPAQTFLGRRDFVCGKPIGHGEQQTRKALRCLV